MRGARRSEDVLNVKSFSGWDHEIMFDEGGDLAIERLDDRRTAFIFSMETAVAIADFILDHVEEVPSPKYRLVED